MQHNAREQYQARPLGSGSTRGSVVPFGGSAAVPRQCAMCAVAGPVGEGRGGGVGTRPWWLALLACGGAYWPLAFEPSAMTSGHPYYCGHPHCRGGGGGGVDWAGLAPQPSTSGSPSNPPRYCRLPDGGHGGSTRGNASPTHPHSHAPET